ncbi:hypothetical protein [Pseudoduganella armeniaca]|uniref:Bacterial Pleckstrin homology domain-containing protein n=1 Tax=Pseudoduganella armeniaca TaxID=2072590 RepID=A0A2R4CA26_9BURK|nr:hypothetical protein [Pseudoduganella armeniaca]AVR96435.1 hypothetical protein C9I28_12550 [Pseudoduganella armeniaca]
MTKAELPVSRQQLGWLAVMLLAPMLLVSIAATWAPPKPGDTAAHGLLGWSVIGAITLGLLALLYVVARRRAIEIDDTAIVVRHSLYTLRLRRADVSALHLRQVATLDQLGLSLRRNGIAACGYYSGWFSGPRGERTFCAISTWPAYLITVEGQARCRHVALSIPPELARRIAAWAPP